VEFRTFGVGEGLEAESADGERLFPWTWDLDAFSIWP